MIKNSSMGIFNSRKTLSHSQIPGNDTNNALPQISIPIPENFPWNLPILFPAHFWFEPFFAAKFAISVSGEFEPRLADFTVKIGQLTYLRRFYVSPDILI